jgi:hypothetical protein
MACCRLNFISEDPLPPPSRYKISLITAEDGGRSFLLLTLACIYRTARHLITLGSHTRTHISQHVQKHKIQYLKRIHTSVILFEQRRPMALGTTSVISHSSHLPVIYTVKSPGYKKESLSVISKTWTLVVMTHTL